MRHLVRTGKRHSWRRRALLPLSLLHMHIMECARGTFSSMPWRICDNHASVGTLGELAYLSELGAISPIMRCLAEPAKGWAPIRPCILCIDALICEIE